MMKKFKKLYTWLAIGVCGLMGLTTTSCVDDMAPEHYYTFTGEMMSDYLNNHEDYSMFASIVDRATQSTRGINIMDLISCYGQYTCFAPDNTAVEEYMKENGYASVEDIPYDVCDTIARTHLINGVVYNTTDFVGLSAVDKVNMNERYLIIEEKIDTLEDETSEEGVLYSATYRLNRSGDIIIAASNDSVVNGIVHTVDHVLSSSNQTLPDLMLENPTISIMNEALTATGIAEYMSNKIKDETWDPKADKYKAYNGKVIYSGAQNDYCTVPDTRNFKFTMFVCPDSILEAKYNITDLESLYKYAQTIYGGEDYDANNPDQLKDSDNPLHKLVAYQCLPFGTTYDKFTRITSTETTLIDPNEWYTTLDPFQTIKIERLTVTRFMKYEGDTRNDLYINRGDMIHSSDRGIHVDRNLEGDYIQDALNGIYFTTDGLLEYSEEVKQNVFNTRIRFDMIDMFPEFFSNNLRNETPWNTESCESPTAPARNYILPEGYLDNVKVNKDGIFLYQGARSWYWSYQGDEYNVVSDNGSYDVTLQLPTVPTGQYQIRLGFCAMASRGICQFYLDGVPKGIPFDMRNTNIEQRTGVFELTSSTTTNKYTKEEIEAKKKDMHNNGWYHGPRAIFTSEYGKKDGTNMNKSYFCNQNTTIRYVLCTETLDENVKHTIRIKSVWAVGSALAMLDYFELVPKSVYGPEGEGKAEDDN